MSQQCRICLEEYDTDENLIVPCRCKGTMKYVHRACLDDWRSQAPNSHNFTNCHECQFGYVIEIVNEDTEHEEQRRIRYYGQVFWDFLVTIISIATTILTITGFIYIIDCNQLIASMIPFFPIFLSYVTIAIVVILFFIGIIFGESMFFPVGDRIQIIYYVVAGLITSINKGYRYISNKMKERRRSIWLRSEAEVRRVKDFKGHENEL